jgi:cell division protein FtsN
LPQLEVEVPEPAARPTQARKRPAETPGSFLLQVGSFSAPADADRLQANLALLGFESHIQRVKIDDTVFNRVRIGPLDDAGAAERAQRRLRDAGIDALLMRVPN